MNDTPKRNPLQILRLPEVIARTGMQRSFIYREAAAGRFPRPVKISHASGWDAAAVEAWILSKLSPTQRTEGEG